MSTRKPMYHAVISSCGGQRDRMRGGSAGVGTGRGLTGGPPPTLLCA